MPTALRVGDPVGETGISHTLVSVEWMESQDCDLEVFIFREGIYMG